MSDGVRNTISTVCNVVFAIAAPALIGTQADLEGNYQGVNKLSGLVSKNLDFDLNNYKGCDAGQIMLNGACIDEPKNQVECGMYADTDEALSWAGSFDKGAGKGKCSGAVISKNYVLSSAACHAGYMTSPLPFKNSLGKDIAVKKVSVPTEEDGDRRWAEFGFGRKRRGANSNEISLHETATAIWSAGDNIVPVCVNRPSVSMFTPHEVVMTGFGNGGLKAETGAIVSTSDAITDLAVAIPEKSDRRWSGFDFGRKRRNVNEKFCLENAGNRRWNFEIGRKRRNAPVDQAPVDQAPVDQAPVDQAPVDQAPVDPTPACYAAEGDAMLFKYPTGQYILGGILRGQGQVETDDSNRKWAGWFGRKRRDNSNYVNSFAYTNVLKYAGWIYKISGVYSKIEEQPASAFDPTDFSPENWKGDYPEFGLADLSRSLEALVEALPALQLINDNSVEKLVDVLNSAPAANQASGLDKFLCNSDGNRRWDLFNNGRKRRSPNNQCLCGSEQAAAIDNSDGNRRWDRFNNGRKRREANDQCLNLNLDDLPVCGMTGDRRWSFDFGRKRREVGEEQCVGNPNLGQLLGGFLGNAGDKRWSGFNFGK